MKALKNTLGLAAKETLGGRQPIQERIGIQNFHAMVKKSTSAEAITRDRVVRFSQCARFYICTYFHLNQQKKQQQEHHRASEESNPLFHAKAQQHLFQDIQHLQKKFRTQRCAMDFGGAFVKAVVMKEEKK